MHEKNENAEMLLAGSKGLRGLDPLFREIKAQVEENRKRFDDTTKTIKDFRRIFDAKSALMNQAIFNDHPSGAIKKETIQTIAVLVEILARLPEKG